MTRQGQLLGRVRAVTKIVEDCERVMETIGEPEDEPSDSESSSSTSSSGTYWLDSSDMSFSLPSLTSAATDDSPVSWGDASSIEAGEIAAQRRGYLTRATRSRLFPGLAAEEALAALGRQ